MGRQEVDLSNVEYMPIEDVPTRVNQLVKWMPFFNTLTNGKAALLKYNNRQRAHQVREIVIISARYHKFQIKTRIIHGTPEIHDTDEWLLYVWKA
ncbi:hypothetical protein LCGC14_1986780 [marine sediment metagenome]|uniref:Uncharacterized protein n=1 Tax=marine sediment metagenome TaxID=412755 RepID=A0A0F9F752_9ZZZZ